MRSYHKVWTPVSQASVALEPQSVKDQAKYIQVVLRSRALDFVNGYNFLSSVAFAQTGGPFQAHWAAINTNGVTEITFSGQQLAGSIFPLRDYRFHPLN